MKSIIYSTTNGCHEHNTQQNYFIILIYGLYKTKYNMQKYRIIKKEYTVFLCHNSKILRLYINFNN